MIKIIKPDDISNVKDKKVSIVKKFRTIFADISLNKLNPDLTEKQKTYLKRFI